VPAAAYAQNSAPAETSGQALRNLSYGSATSETGALPDDSADALFNLVLGETSTFPIGSSAGGFTWVFDSSLRVPVRRSQSFGPMFAERPFTTGKGRLNAGISFQHMSFTSLGDQPLDNIENTSNFANGDVSTWTSSINVALDRTIVSASYGVHDRVDVGVIVPFGRTKVHGFSTKFVRAGGIVTHDLREDSSGSSVGMGDVVIRGKAAVSETPQFSTAVSFDLRLPTGETEQLMGTGVTQAKVMFIAGGTAGSVNPHLNVGYTFGGSGLQFDPDDPVDDDDTPELTAHSPSEEFDYTVGADVAVTPRITVAGDVIGRVVRNAVQMSRLDTGAGDPERYINMLLEPGTVHKLLAAVGAKVNLGGTWLLTGTVLFPLNSNGIKPAVTPVIGLERAF
jgi:hypothetical protein